MRKALFVAAMFMCVFLTQRTRAASLPECPAANIDRSCVLLGNRTAALTITGDNVTLDCQGFGVIGPAGSFGAGIRVNRRSQPRINNCTVSGWDTGIMVEYVPTSIFLKQNSVTNNKTGVMIVNSNTVYLSWGTVAFNSDDGIDLVNNAFVSVNHVGIRKNTDKGITYKNDLTANNIRLNVIENVIEGNGIGLSVQDKTQKTKGMICGNGFWTNQALDLFSNATGVVESDSRSANAWGVCLSD